MIGVPDPALITLLSTAATRRRDLDLSSFDRLQIDWVIANGLGPLLCYATAKTRARARLPLWHPVLSADLTARVETGDQLEALEEVLDRCERAWPLTLLKGTSICSEYYPEPHLRPMRDLDILVSEAHVSAVENALVDLGYQRRHPGGEATPSNHHHGVPLWHPRTRNWVEVHWGLVPPNSPLAAEPAFRRETVVSETRPFEFRNRPASRLSTELQIVHLACHWAERVPIPGGMIALVDLSLILAREAVDWSRIFRWIEGPGTAVRLYLALSYLHRLELARVPTEVLSRMERKQRTVSRSSRAVLNRLIDRYVVAGAGFRVPVTEAVFRTLWEELLEPRPAWRNILGLGRFALPNRMRRTP